MSTKLRIVPGVLLPVIVIFAFTDGGCSSSSLTNVWRDPDYKSSPMTNMLIVAAKHQPVNRRLWEDEIVAALSAYGVTSVPSYKVFPDSIPNPDQVGSAVRENRFDGVLFIRRLPTEVSTTYVPGSVTRERRTEYNPRSQTYTTVYEDVRQAAYADTSRIVRHEIVAFAPQGQVGRMVWAGTGEMIDPDSRDEVRNEITGLVVPELSREGIIPERAPGK